MKNPIRTAAPVSRLFATAALSALSLPALATHTDYAVLFSGGYDASNNHARYYDQTLRMWNILTGTLGFNPANIYLLFSDGQDPGKDQCSQYDAGGNCSGWKNSDWSAVAAANTSVLPATPTKLQQTITFLDNAMSSEDSFYFWAFDHGSQTADPGHVTLTAWDQGAIRDDQFASWVDDLQVKAEIYAFAECFSGGMADDLNLAAHPNRFAAWAAGSGEPSWGDGWAKAWADGIDNGLRWSRDLGQYALTHDIYGPKQLGKETPGWAGANIHIITNDIPEPASLLLAASALIPLLGRRRKI